MKIYQNSNEPIYKQIAAQLKEQYDAKIKQADAEVDEILSEARKKAVANEAQIVVTHQDLAGRAKTIAPNARIITISNFMSAPEYDQLAQELKA